MLNRRHLLQAGVGVAAFAGIARAVEPIANAPAAVASTGEQALISAIGGCLAQGNLCLEHCIARLSGGDTSLAECARSVRDMLAVCAATQALVASNSVRQKAAVQLCIDICEDCERACRKHEAHHAICKACAEACATVVKAGRALVA